MKGLDFMNKFDTYVENMMKNERFREMDQYVQHGDTSTLEHSLAVAYYSFALSKKLRLNWKEKSLIRGALLHDYYLYDWHEKEDWHKLHGFKHSAFALKNADKDYALTDTEKDIIANHMWPLTVGKLPKSKEAALVCMVDKYCSLLETFHIKYKAPLKNRYVKLSYEEAAKYKEK